MKKWVLFCAVFLAMFVPALSEESIYDSEILFREIHWHCDIDAAVEALCAENDFRYKYERDATIRYESFWSTGWMATAKEGGFAVSLVPKTQLFVAGHAVEEIELEALYGVVDDVISKENSDSKLVSAQYEFDVNLQNVESVYDDLFVKLCDIYGQPYYTSEVIDMYAVWHGQNETGVYIIGGRNYLYLCYGRTDFHNEISEIVDAHNLELVSDVNSTDGL